MVKWSYTPRVQIVGAARNPESITAGMARISRDPTPVPQLIKEARDNTALARQRNQRVVYEYGHTSVAEHGCFSAAIWDIPRLLSLEIVRHRLAAYTQHSGRFIPFEKVTRQFYLPRAYRRGRARRLVEEAVGQSYAAYRTIYAGCTAYLLDKFPRMRASFCRTPRHRGCTLRLAAGTDHPSGCDHERPGIRPHDYAAALLAAIGIPRNR